jgi:molecular chaperone GrpE
MAENKKKVTEEKVETEEVTSEAPEMVEKSLLEKKEQEANDYKDKWMRSVAEFDNYKKRNALVWQEAFKEGATDVLLKILPIGDNLEMALSMNLDEKTAEGIKLIIKKYMDTLKGLGVTEINPIGEKFDPLVAEALMQVEGEEGEESDIVKQVFQKGYKLNEKIIRYAKVSVTK